MIHELDDAKLQALIQASDNGEEWAQREYGRIFDKYETYPDFIDRVCRLRLNIYKAPAQRGDKKAILRYAHALAHLGRTKEAYDWYMVLIDKGDTDAMLALSEQYNEYGCFGHDPAKERYWLNLAATKGNPEAQCSMGRECQCESDHYNALRWYALSAKQNYPEGKIGYAYCLQDQLSALKEYANGMPEVVPGRYRYIKEAYGTLPPQKHQDAIRDLFWRTEALYLEGLQGCTSDSYLSDAFMGLTNLYLYPRGVIEPLYYHAAYYQYESYRVCDNSYSYDRCLKIIKEHGLKVTERDLQEWGQIGLYKWAEKRGIDITAKEKRNTSSTEKNSSGNKVSADKVVEYIVKRFERENNIDLSNDTVAMRRIRIAVDKKISRIENGETVSISLSNLTANAAGPVHLQMSVSLDRIRNKTDAEQLDIHLVLNVTASEAMNGCTKEVHVKACGKKYSVSIPKKIKDGTVLRLSGAGKQDPNTGKKGNIFIKVQITTAARGRQTSSGGTTGYLRLTVKTSLNPLGLADGCKYRFIIDGDQEITLISQKNNVAKAKELSCGKHTVTLIVYGHKGNLLHKDKPRSFSISSGKTTAVSVNRGGFLSDPKIEIKQL